jgi:hypothetical protein
MSHCELGRSAVGQLSATPQHPRLPPDPVDPEEPVHHGADDRSKPDEAGPSDRRADIFLGENDVDRDDDGEEHVRSGDRRLQHSHLVHFGSAPLGEPRRITARISWVHPSALSSGTKDHVSADRPLPVLRRTRSASRCTS